jgi:hypothetical protein
MRGLGRLRREAVRVATIARFKALGIEAVNRDLARRTTNVAEALKSAGATVGLGVIHGPLILHNGIPDYRNRAAAAWPGTASLVRPTAMPGRALAPATRDSGEFAYEASSRSRLLVAEASARYRCDLQ